VEGHVALERLPDPLGVGFLVLFLEPGDDPFKAHLHPPGLPPAPAEDHLEGLVQPVQDGVLLLLGKVLEGGVEVEAEVIGEGLELVPEEAAAGVAALRPGDDRPLSQRALGVHHELAVELELVAEPAAGGAGAVGGVEGEDPGLELLEHGPVLGTGELLGEELLFVLVGVVDPEQAVAPEQGELDALGDPGPLLGPDHHPVHHQVDVVLLVAGESELEGLLDAVEDPVHPHPGVPLLHELLEEGLVLPLSPPDQGGHEDRPGPLGPLHEPVGDLAGRGALDLSAAGRAVGLAGPGEEEPQVVVDLGNRAHRRAGVVGGRLLVDRDRRGEPLDPLDVGLVHHPQELAGVGGEALDVATLALGVDGVEGQRALAGAGDPGDDDELAPGELEVDVLQVVLARAPNDR